MQNKKEKYRFLFELFIQRVFLSAIIALNDIDMLCAIQYHLYNLKNVENTHGGATASTKSINPPWMVFTFFKLCKYYQITQSVSVYSVYKTGNLVILLHFLLDFCDFENDGTYPHPDSCFQYITCFQAITFEMDCPTPLSFDEEEKICNLREFSKCSGE